MAGGVYLFRFFDGAVVKPKDDIAVGIKIGTSDGNRLVCILSEEGEGASGVKSNAFDRMGVDVVLTDGTLDNDADTAPYVRCGLFL